MEMMAGDEEEHSILLMNFFLGLGKKAWLLIGGSITNALCSYVLTEENREYTIWYQGQPVRVNEPHNPVKVVSALVTPENVNLNYIYWVFFLFLDAFKVYFSIQI